MSVQEGGFYSGEDADSLPSSDAACKKEGAFYVWSMAELRSLLGEEDADVFARVYDVRDEGNTDPRIVCYWLCTLVILYSIIHTI